MKGFSKLSYIVIEAKNLDQWKEFAQCLGLHVDTSSEGALNLRTNEKVYSLKVVQGDEDDVVALGWEFQHQQDLQDYVAGLQAKNYIAIENSNLAAERHVERLFALADLNNISHEFIYKLADTDTALAANTTEFMTENGIGHALVCAQSKADSLKFYQDLGLGITDTILEEVMPGMVIDATFMHVNGRHHSFAFAPMPPGSKKVHHIMLECLSIDDVGRAYENCIQHKDNIVLDFGKHPNDEVFSFYVNTPSGFAIEIGSGGKKINFENWIPESFEKLSAWGHKPKF